MFKKIPLLSLFIWAFAQSVSGQQIKYRFETGKMGSPFSIIVSTKDSVGLRAIIQSAFDYAEDLENQLSDYREHSDVSKINRLAGTQKFFPIQQSFKEILTESLHAFHLTDGKLNVFAGGLVKEWRKARSTKVLPDSLLLKQIAAVISSPCLVFSSDSSSIYLKNKFCQLDFGSIGKGFVAQKVLEYLVSWGYTNVLIDAGGKIVCTQTVDGNYWNVGIELPMSNQIASKVLKLKNTSVSSSGKTYQHVWIDGKNYSHVLNPKTGWALEHAKSATVVVEGGAVSDWIATAATILELNELQDLIKKFKDLKILVWQNNASKLDVLFNQDILSDK